METTIRQANFTSGRDAAAADIVAGPAKARHAHVSTRFMLQARPKLLAGLRIMPAAMLLVSVATMAPSAGATGCGQGANIAVSGGIVSNETTVDVSADGGTADADARGGDGNIAVAGSGGYFGDGGDADAGNGGIAAASASGGMIDLDTINSGNNAGNTIAVSADSATCGYSGGNVAISGGTVENDTSVRLSADGGTADADARGGDHNLAFGGAGGFFGNGGDADAGNGGIAVADANGGAITIGTINSGNNRGNAIRVGSRRGLFGRASTLRIYGGTVRNTTDVSISADGGTATADASGGDGNIAVGGSGGIVGNGGAAAAGNGGIAVADASGGAVTVGNINSGGNSGNTIVVEGSQSGDVVVDGGTVSNETTVDISADGGTATADASGGDGNIAVGGSGGIVGDGGSADAGNGGVAVADASGGSVNVGNINSGGNTGNTIVVGS
jgi:hypothetical protein